MSHNRSDRTKKFKRLNITFTLLSCLLTYGPLVAAIIVGFTDVSVETEKKLYLGFCLSAAVILTIYSIMLKHHFRSTVWVVVLGIYFCIQNIEWLIISIAVSTVLDEFIIEPVKKKVRAKFVINKEIDIRNG